MMTDEQRKEIVDVMDVGFALYEAIKKSKADGKITVTDALNFFPVVQELPEAIKDFDTIPAGWKDAEDADRTFFADHFKAELDLPNDEVEGLIEDVFNWVLQTALIVKKATEVL